MNLPDFPKPPSSLDPSLTYRENLICNCALINPMIWSTSEGEYAIRAGSPEPRGRD